MAETGAAQARATQQQVVAAKASLPITAAQKMAPLVRKQFPGPWQNRDSVRAAEARAAAAASWSGRQLAALQNNAIARGLGTAGRFMTNNRAARALGGVGRFASTYGGPIATAIDTGQTAHALWQGRGQEHADATQQWYDDSLHGRHGFNTPFDPWAAKWSPASNLNLAAHGIGQIGELQKQRAAVEAQGVQLDGALLARQQKQLAPVFARAQAGTPLAPAEQQAVARYQQQEARFAEQRRVASAGHDTGNGGRPGYPLSPAFLQALGSPNR